MTNWKTYKIGSTASTHDEVMFSFGIKGNAHIDYRSERENSILVSIICANIYPFNTWKEEDYIEIDNDKTRYKDAWHVFDDTSIVRKVSSSTNIITTRGSSSDIVISSGLVNAMGSSRTMELSRHMSRMVDENDKEYELKIEDNTNTRFTYSLICRKQK